MDDPLEAPRRGIRRGVGLLEEMEVASMDLSESEQAILRTEGPRCGLKPQCYLCSGRKLKSIQYRFGFPGSITTEIVFDVRCPEGSVHKLSLENLYL